MSVEAFSWALTVPLGGNPKVILLGMANHAHPDGTEAYPSVDTLATYAHCDRRTAQRNVRKLEEDGWIRADGFGPRGEAKYRLAMGQPFTTGGGKMPPAADSPQGGGNGDRGGAAPAPPEPSNEPSKETEGENASARDPKDSLPSDFPEELKPHARHVFRLLRQVARDHNAAAVRPLRLGRLMMSQPHKPFVETAHELYSWAADPPRPVKDVVGTYATFLKQRRPLAAVERLDDEGIPQSGPGAPPAGVTSLHSRRTSNADRVQANIDALEQMGRLASTQTGTLLS